MPYLLDMRPLFHPALQDVTVEGILYALSDPVRVAMYAEIAAQPCTQKCTTLRAVMGRPIPKSTLSQHFRILRESGLVHAERFGVEMRLTPRCAEIETRFPGLISAILSAHRVEIEEKIRRKSAARKTARSIRH
jgi:DNA-binding transcriptional ArsR family regulator